jgi:hypothetical protein
MTLDRTEAITNFSRNYGEDTSLMFYLGNLDPVKLNECFLPFVERFATGEIKNIYLVSRASLEKYAGPRYIEKFERNPIYLLKRIMRKSKSLSVVADDSITAKLPIAIIVDKGSTTMPVFTTENIKLVPLEADLNSKDAEDYRNQAFGGWRDDPIFGKKSHSHGEGLIEFDEGTTIPLSVTEFVEKSSRRNRLY